MNTESIMPELFVWVAILAIVIFWYLRRIYQGLQFFKKRDLLKVGDDVYYNNDGRILIKAEYIGATSGGRFIIKDEGSETFLIDSCDLIIKENKK